MQNATKFIVSGLIIAIISSITTYAWNNQSIDEMVEQANREAIIKCITKARTETTAQKILQATETCNSNLFTTVSSPLVSTGYVSTGTVNLTPVSEVPIGIKYSSDIVSEPKKSIDVSVEKKSKIGDTLNVNPVSRKDTSRSSKQIFEQVKHLGYREAPTVALIQSCKDGSIDPRHCIVIGLTLMYNEAGNMQNSKACTTRNNCFGINSGKKVYTSLMEGMDTWVVKYNKYWYKAQSASFFYSSAGKVSPSRYCTSESSSNTSIGCPRGLDIATKQWEKLYPIIY